MADILSYLHIIIAISLIGLILLQDPKGGTSMFGGGGSNSLFGATGAQTFLTQMTKGFAIAFGLCCIGLTIASRPGGKSVIDKLSSAQMGGFGQGQGGSMSTNPSENQQQQQQQQAIQMSPSSNQGSPMSNSSSSDSQSGRGSGFEPSQSR